jgi:hypothetical protein
MGEEGGESFDHLVGAAEQRERNGEAEGLGFSSRASRRSEPSNRRFALQHEAVEVAALGHVIVRIGLMHDAAVIP